MLKNALVEVVTSKLFIIREPQLIHFRPAELLGFIGTPWTLDLMGFGHKRGVLSQPVPPPTFPNPSPNFRTFPCYVPTYLCFIFVQPCLFPICIFHLTPRSLLPHDLMFCLNLLLVSFVFVHMSYPLVRYTDPDLIEILLCSIKDM